MSDEATPEAGGGTEAVEVSGAGQSIADIVDASGLFGSGGTSDTTTPASEPAAAGTGEGDSDKSKTAKPAAKVEFFSDEQLDKFVLKDFENPSFDWSKVPPERAKAVKAAIALLTPERQRLADERRAMARERRKEPPQPTKEAEVDPQDATNQQIVADALKAQGVDPKVLAEMTEDAIRTKGIALAAQTVPQYLSDEKFNEAVNLTIVSDERLASLADSENPDDIAVAITTAAAIVQRNAFATELTTLKGREAAITAKEKELETKLEELETERTKLNRSKSTVAGGSGQGKPPAAPKKDSDKDVNEIVDDLGYFEGGKTLRLG